MIKKLALVIAATGCLVGALTANAQLFPYTGTTTAPSSSVIETSSTASSTATSSIATMSSTISSTVSAMSSTEGTSDVAQPVYVTAGAMGVAGQYLQIDGLIVVSVPPSTATGPVQILAANPAYDTMTAASTTMPATTAALSCEQFATDSTPMGIPAACPAPPTASTPNASGTYYSPYTIDVDAATQLLLSDRSTATLGNITPGDTINVYGYYSSDGTIEAEIIRDMSKPVGAAATSGETETTVAPGPLPTADLTSTAALQAELDQLETLVAQLEVELGISVSSTTTTTASCPMIPAGSTSTAGCPPPGATTSSIYY